MYDTAYIIILLQACFSALYPVSLEQALRIPQAIGENYAFKPTAPLDIAAAINLSPQSSQFRMICGAAMALYDRRFVLLVKEGVRLPSNLQGLYVVSYTGDTMDGDTTIRLLKAIQDIKNHPPPKFSAAPNLAIES